MKTNPCPPHLMALYQEARNHKRHCTTRVIVVAHDTKPPQLLLLTRAEGNNLAGQEESPGGTLELNENPIDGALRETFEESGIQLSTSPTFLDYSDFTKPNGVECRLFFFVAHLASHTIPIILSPEEHSSYRWVKLTDLEKTQLHPGDLSFITKHQKQLELWG